MPKLSRVDRADCYIPSMVPFSRENSQSRGVGWVILALSTRKGAALCPQRHAHILGADLPSLPAALPWHHERTYTRPYLCWHQLTNNSTHTGVCKKEEMFPTLFMSLAKSQYRNVTKRILEKIIPVNFTPRCRIKTKQNISESKPATYP